MRTVTVIAVILFALSGLITGFAFGAFVHFGPAKTSNANRNTTTIVQKKGGTTPTATKAVQTILPLGWPAITPSAYTEIADGTTTYTTTAQVTDQSKGKTVGKPIYAAGITFKIWLTKEADKTSDALIANNYALLKNINNIQNTFPREVQGGLVFTATPQTQMSNAQGQVTWNYTVAQSVDPGTYYLMVLTDWNGIHFNWSWQIITIKKAN